MKQGTQARFAWLDAVLASELTRTEKNVAAFLFARADSTNGECYPSQKAIALGCRIGRRTVQVSLGQLVTEEWLIRKHRAGPLRDRNRTTVYQIHIPNEALPTAPRQGTNEAQPRAPREARRGAVRCADEAHPTAQGTGKRTKESKKTLTPHEMKTAICGIFDLDENALSRSEHARYQRVAKDYLATPRASPDEIRRRRERYRKRWPRVTCSPEAVLKHWSELDENHARQNSEAGRSRKGSSRGKFDAVESVRAS